MMSPISIIKMKFAFHSVFRICFSEIVGAVQACEELAFGYKLAASALRYGDNYFSSGKESRRASTGAPRDRFAHIPWPPQLFPAFTSIFYHTTTTTSYMHACTNQTPNPVTITN
ncbi:hypothetical protein VNO78_20785 [Psophocarpus tetragonolobus]|uniref:Uncharacterized protein n=1 Tax=Psophocarpus tetragonolobus TaxID=3891 RepID=A0AAN9XHH3_PSOTE